MKYKCEKCNSFNLAIVKNGPHNELFCKDCLSYIKFISKKEARRLEQILKEK